jgi:hypothetical protein
MCLTRTRSWDRYPQETFSFLPGVAFRVVVLLSLVVCGVVFGSLCGILCLCRTPSCWCWSYCCWCYCWRWWFVFDLPIMRTACYWPAYMLVVVVPLVAVLSGPSHASSLDPRTTSALWVQSASGQRLSGIAVGSSSVGRSVAVAPSSHVGGPLAAAAFAPCRAVSLMAVDARASNVSHLGAVDLLSSASWHRPFLSFQNPIESAKLFWYVSAMSEWCYRR